LRQPGSGRAVAQNGAAVRRPQRTRAAPILINGACRPPMLIETPNLRAKNGGEGRKVVCLMDTLPIDCVER